jgi:hypothetical protein
VADAVELLSAFNRHEESATSDPLPIRDKVRIVLEGLLFGWFVPGSRKEPVSSSEDHDV